MHGTMSLNIIKDILLILSLENICSSSREILNMDVEFYEWETTKLSGSVFPTRVPRTLLWFLRGIVKNCINSLKYRKYSQKIRNIAGIFYPEICTTSNLHKLPTVSLFAGLLTFAEVGFLGAAKLLQGDLHGRKVGKLIEKIRY